MSAHLTLQTKEEQLYVPEKARIIEAEQFTATEKFFRLELLSGKSLGHDPGQFVQVSILGIGEAPISISSPPGLDNTFEMCVRAVGNVTNKLHTLQKGDHVFIRGPFGHGFDQEIMDRMNGKHLLFIGGGIGYVPLRSLINKVVKESVNYHKVSILFGCKHPSERLYVTELAELSQMGGKIEFLETVDRSDNGWQGNVGVITTLIPKVDFDPANTIAVIVGPPVMYKFVLISLMDRQVPKDQIYMSLERRMKCGVGKCGHCQMEGIYVCQEGPVFNYAEVQDNREVL
ncbi:oxidoreductase [candidate division KSB3 bacterium]|uniref:Oxidoreductase n=1 Tax=candidate division KSB3 bacterium TaxID=2044937 RepID=A0A9D5JZJ3_9BACT|nr:oxidoreductase [candidate division KSB3 bacterium]MBD3326666.1 oxidoreductase [candidate division KSB3 bacterium]